MCETEHGCATERGMGSTHDDEGEELCWCRIAAHGFLHYLMCCRLLCPVHCEPQKHIRGTAIHNWDADGRLNNEETEFITSEW